MGLSAVLSNALTGLNVNQQALQVLSQNISNSNTPGYSKQVVNQQPIYVQGQGAGVSIESITRKVDQYLIQAVQGQNSTVGQANTLNDYNNRIQLLLGQPGSTNSIDSFINNFFSSLQSLAQSPTNVTLQQAVVNNAGTMTTQIQQLANGLQQLQFQADGDINTALSTVNSDLQNIFKLNGTITQNAASGQSVAGLQDQRDGLIKDVSQYLSIQTFTRSDGSIDITTNSGVPLVTDNVYQVSYNPAGSATQFGTSAPLAPILVTRLNDSGVTEGAPQAIVSGGTSSQVISSLSNGTIQGLITMRDKTIPAIVSQIDTLVATITSQANAIQNSGSGFPGANGYTGTRTVNAADSSQWAGSARIAVLTPTGNPLTSPYPDEPNGMPPLDLDLANMNSENGQGNPTVQDIINSINQYYGTPQNKVELGNLNNIQLASDSPSLPGSPQQLNVDFNLNNTSSLPSNFYVTGVTVTDNNNVSVTPVTSTIPAVALAATGTYVTHTGSKVVTVNTVSPNNLVEGQTVFLSTPNIPGGIGGINASEVGGYFTISNVTGSSFDIGTLNPAAIDSSTDSSGQTATPPYATVPAGDTMRTTSLGMISANLSGASVSPYYNVTVNVGVDDGTGIMKTSQITYRVLNQNGNTMNTLYGGVSANGDATLVQPTTAQPIATAMLVDANGVELPKVNGKYITTQNGYLQIKAAGGSNVVAIDSLDSKQIGRPNANPVVAGTNQSFSSYFDLNDFFQSVNNAATGTSVAGSAVNMKIQSRIQTNPSLISLGTLTKNADTSALVPNLTYSLNSGDNSVIQKLSALSLTAVGFLSAGGLPATTQTFSAYAAQIIAIASTNAASAATDQSNAQNLLDGYTQQSSAISGVNLDTELANTVIYQNAYAASARVITVAGDLFNTLLQAFN